MVNKYNNISSKKLKISDIFIPGSELADWEQEIWNKLAEHSSHFEPPVCIGVYGNWGAGKSSIIKAAQAAKKINNTNYYPKILDVKRLKKLNQKSNSDNLDNYLIKEEKDKDDHNYNKEFLYVLDDLDKYEGNDIYNVLFNLLNIFKAYHSNEKESDSPRVLIMANEKLLLERLKTKYQNEIDAKNFLTSIIPVEYYIPRADGQVVFKTFWEGTESDKTNSNESTENEFPSDFLKKFCEEFPTENLRVSRKFIVSLKWFAEFYFHKPAEEAIKGHEEYKKDPTSTSLILQLAGTLLAYIRTFCKEIYNEIVDHPSKEKIEIVVDTFKVMEYEFAKQKAGFMPSSKEAVFKTIIERHKGAGLYKLNDGLESGNLLKEYRTFREVANKSLRKWLSGKEENSEKEKNLVTPDFNLRRFFEKDKQVIAEFFKEVVKQ